MNNIGPGVVTALTAGSIKDAIDNAPDKKSVEEILQDLHILFVETATWLKLQQSVSVDIFKFVQINKTTAGPSFTPVHVGERIHNAIITGVDTTLNVICPGIGSFNMLAKGGVWLVIDLPDNTQYFLDPANANPSVTFWSRCTDQSIS